MLRVWYDPSMPFFLLLGFFLIVALLRQDRVERAQEKAKQVEHERAIQGYLEFLARIRGAAYAAHSPTEFHAN